MSHAKYSRRDIPKELQRLIDHTDEGIAQLYRVARRSRNGSTQPRYLPHTRAASSGRSVRRHQEAARKSRLRQGREGFYDRGASPDRFHSFSTMDSEDVEDEDGQTSPSFLSSRTTSTDAMDTSGKRHHTAQIAAKLSPLPPSSSSAPLEPRQRSATRRPTPSSPMHDYSATRDSPRRPQRYPYVSSAASSPHRPLGGSPGSPLHSSALSGSRLSVSPLPQAPTRRPPWVQRGVSPAASTEADDPRDGSGHHLYHSQRSTCHPHVAAQQSTQRPGEEAGPSARHRALTFTATSTNTTKTSSHSWDGAEATAVDATGRRRDPAKSAAAAAMLSTFGRRWGGVFEEMLAGEGPGHSQSHKPAQDQKPAASHVTAASPAMTETAGPLSTASIAAPTAQPSPPLTSPPSSTLQLVSAPSSEWSPNRLLLEQLQRELRTKDDLSAQERLSHAREIAELRQTITVERAAAVKEVTADMAGSYALKQRMMQETLDAERQRHAELEARLEKAMQDEAEAKARLREAEVTTHQLRKDSATSAEASSVQIQQVARLEQEKAQLASTLRQMESDEKIWRAKEVDWRAREQQLRDEVASVEEQLRQQGDDAQAALSRVEAEFMTTSQSYQTLITGASQRMTYLEKCHNKYKVLKETHALLRREHAQLEETWEQRGRDQEAELTAARAEARELREHLQQRDSASRQALASHDELVKELKHRIDLQEDKAKEQTLTLQQNLETAHRTIEVLRSQLDGLRQDVVEGQRHHEQVQSQLAQARLQWDQERENLQRSTATYKSRSEDTIAQLKRQIKEKDAKLQTLAASSTEPLQRLRQQLDDERGRRARLEEQFRTYKKKAKEAEEQAAAEMRMEQLRVSGLATPGAGRMRAPTATPSPVGGPSRGLTATTSSHRSASSRPRSSRDAPMSRHSQSHFITSPPQVQTTAVGATPQPVSRWSGGVPATFFPAAVSVPEVGTASERNPRTHAAPHRVTPPADASITPSGTVGLLSDISRTSACSSGFDDDLGTATAVAAAAVARTGEPVVATWGASSHAVPHSTHLLSGAAVERPPLPSPAEETALIGGSGEQPRNGSTPAFHSDPLVAELYGDPVVQAHEHRMTTFHASASEVLRKIAGSREEFLSQCATIVRKTAAQRPKMQPIRRGRARLPENGSDASSCTDSGAD